VARVIAEAAVRLRVDGKGLALEIRTVIRKAMQEAAATQVDLKSPTKKMADDSDNDTRRLTANFKKISSGVLGVARDIAGAAVSGGKLLLIGTAAIGALAGVTQLALGVGALVQAAAQAAGVLGLLPAVFATFKAGTAAISLGLQGMGDAMSAVASGDAAAFDEALKNLSPSARDFARAVRDVKPAFDEMRLDVQEALFQGLADVVKPLANTYLPIATAGFQGVARQTSIAARSVADFLLQGAQVQKVSQFSANLQVTWGNLAGALQPAVSALLDLVTTGSNFLPGLTAGLNDWATAFSQRISEAAKSGELAAFFQRAIDSLKTLGDIAGNVFGAIRNIIGAASTEGGGFLQRIQEITQRFQDFTGSVAGQEAFGGFFESMGRVMKALGPAFFELITIIGRDFIPILADVAEVLGPVLRPLFEVFGQLLQALRPLIVELAKAFGTVLKSMIPFFDALAKAIDSAMPTLGPVIQDIAQSLADLFEAMVPLAPVFVDLLEAVLPILPPFIQMVTDLMPDFIDLIKALMPAIEGFVDIMKTVIPIFTDIVGFLADIFIPIIKFLSTVIGGIWEVVSFVVGKVWDTITTVFGAIGDFFVGFWQDTVATFQNFLGPIADFFSGGFSHMFDTVVNWAGNVLGSIRDTMAGFVSSIGDGIGNAVQWFLDLPGRVLGALGDVGSWLFDAGKRVIQGLINGLKSAVSSVLNFFKNLVSQAIDSVTSALGIGSPSKVFHTIGEQIGAGLVRGLNASTASVVDAAGGLAQAALSAASIDGAGVSLSTPDLAAGLATAAATPVAATVIQQTNVMRPGTDVQQFANTVMQRGFGDVLAGASILGVRRNPVQAGVDDQWVSL